MLTSSASTIVGATGHPLFRINYPQSKEVPSGECLLSHAFKVGECSWRIWLGPNGIGPSSVGYISVCLGLDETVVEPVKARACKGWEPSAELHPVHYLFGVLCYWYWRFLRVFRSEGAPREVRSYCGCCLTIRCEVTVFRSTENRLVIVPPSNLHLHLGDLLESKVGADVTFQVAGDAFSAHKCVLSARSPVFKAELLDKAREGAVAGVCIQIDDIDAPVFKALLHFVYTDSLPEMPEEEEFAMAKHLLVVAERYDMHRLKLICAETLRDYIDLDTVANLLVLAEKHKCQSLKKDCIEYLRDPPALDVVMAFGDSVEHVTQNCPALLRELWDVWFENDPIQDDLALSL